MRVRAREVGKSVCFSEVVWKLKVAGGATLESVRIYTPTIAGE